ncbi:MAG: FecR domain-containing protein [Phycisphaerae bacterium]|nr:FecR domain-containing protein [Phycisphaerae bacterium]
MSNIKNKILDELVYRMLEDEITDEEFAQLDEMIATSVDAARQYAELTNIYAGLSQPGKISLLTHANKLGEALRNDNVFHDFIEEHYKDLSEKQLISGLNIDKDKNSGISYQRKTISRMTFLRVFGAIAAMVLVAFFLDSLSKFAVRPGTPVSPIVARLVKTVDAVWKLDGKDQIESGVSLRVGLLTLEQGVAKIEFNNGAEIVLEAPASIDLVSNQEMILISGKLSAHVNENAVGFMVRTKNSKIIDLGTDFGISVDDNGSTDVHVFKGKVALLLDSLQTQQNVQANKIDLYKGDARRVNYVNEIEIIDNDRLTFVMDDEFEVRYQARAGSKYYAWLEYSYQLRRRDDMVAYYTFEQDAVDPQMLRNMAHKTQDRVDGILASKNILFSSPEWVQGRWPSKTALQFKRDYKHFVYTEKDYDLCLSGPVTIAAWVKLDGYYDGGHILSNRMSETKSNYQMAYNNSNMKKRLQFLRYGYGNGEGRTLYSNEVTGTWLRGWHHLVVSHDNENVRFYVDGRLMSVDKYDYKDSSVLTNIEIGTDKNEGDSNMFNGIIGEIAIYKSVLPENEIKEMYFKGKP